MKAKKLQKKPKNSVWDVLQSSLLSYCNIKSIAPLGSYLGVFPWTTLTNPTFLLRKPSEVGVKRHYFQHFALKSINQHKQSRAKHSSPWDLLHPTAATDTRHTKRLPPEPIKGSECPETSSVQPTKLDGNTGMSLQYMKVVSVWITKCIQTLFSSSLKWSWRPKPFPALKSAPAGAYVVQNFRAVKPGEQRGSAWAAEMKGF